MRWKMLSSTKTHGELIRCEEWENIETRRCHATGGGAHKKFPLTPSTYPPNVANGDVFVHNAVRAGQPP